jgi:hypothetical protein
VLLAIAALPKVAVLLAPRPDLYLAGSRGVPQTWNGEEIHRGTTALELLHGPVLPLLDYHYAPFFGGSLVVSLVAVPLYALLGTSIVVLKLVPLLFHLLSVAALYFAVRRLAGPRAAFLAALLLAASPPGYSIHALTAFGTHVEANALSMALLALFLSTWWRDDGEHPPLGRAFLWGVLAGFSIYFGYIVLLTLAALVTARFLCDKLFFLRRDALVALGGVLVGLAPWFAYNVPRGFPGLAIYGRSLGAAPLPRAESAGVGERLVDLARHGFPDAAFFRALGPISGHTQNIVYGAGILLLALGVLWPLRARLVPLARAALRRRTSPAEISFAPLLLLQPLLFLAAYALTDFKLGDPPESVVAYRYVHVVWPWLFAAAGITLDGAIRAGGARASIAHAAHAVLVALGLVGTLLLVSPANRWSDLATPGYSYPAFGRFVVLTFDQEPETILAAIDRAEELRSAEELDEMLFGMGMQLKESSRPMPQAGLRLREFRERAEGLRSEIHAHVPARYQPYFESVRESEPPFGRMGRDERAAFWKWYRSATSAPPEDPHD